MTLALVLAVACLPFVADSIDPPFDSACTAPPSTPAHSQHCATSTIVGNWTGKVDGMWVRMEIVPLGGRQFGFRGPSNGPYTPCGQANLGGSTCGISVGTVRSDGSVFLNCTRPHWCHFSHTVARTGAHCSIDSQVGVFSSWHPPQFPSAAGTNCSQLTMMVNYTTPLPSWGQFGYGNWTGRFCNNAADPTCPAPPGVPHAL